MPKGSPTLMKPELAVTLTMVSMCGCSQMARPQQRHLTGLLAGERPCRSEATIVIYFGSRLGIADGPVLPITQDTTVGVSDTSLRATVLLQCCATSPPAY
jgi:hypothetical protein